MGLEQTQDARQVDRFIDNLITTNKSLEDRVAQLESHEGSASLSIALIADQKAAGVGGGGLTSGSWLTRTLNTIHSDPNSIVSLSSNQFTLQSGTYLIRGSAPAFGVERHKIRLRNITTGTTAKVGKSAYASIGGAGYNYSAVTHLITITVATVFEIQHRVETTNAVNGAGVESGAWGEVELYTEVEVIKIS